MIQWRVSDRVLVPSIAMIANEPKEEKGGGAPDMGGMGY